VGDARAGRQVPSAPRRSSLRALLRRALLLGIAFLYVLSIPWYRATGEPAAIWWGLPDWVAVAIGCYVAVAVLNAVAWLLTDVPDAVPGDEDTA
jgi:hypothetical protein